MNDVASIIQCLQALGELRAILRSAHIGLEARHGFERIAVDVMPWRGDTSEYADGGTIISMTLNANLIKPVEEGRHVLVISITVRHSKENWHIDVEAGWNNAQAEFAASCEMEVVESDFAVAVDRTKAALQRAIQAVLSELPDGIV